MCLVHSNLEKMLEKVLLGYQAEEWGTTAGDKLGACQKKTMQGCFLSRIYLGTWFVCSKSPWFPVLGVLRTQTRSDP